MGRDALDDNMKLADVVAKRYVALVYLAVLYMMIIIENMEEI